MVRFRLLSGLIIAVLSMGLARAAEPSPMRAAAIECAKTSTANYPVPQITRDLLVAGHVRPDRCVMRDFRAAEASDLLEAADSAFENGRPSPARFGQAVSTLENLTDRSLTGHVESFLFTLYQLNSDAPDRKAKMRQWAEASVRKSPHRAYWFAVNYWTGRMDGEIKTVPQDPAFAEDMLRMGLATGCTACLSLVNNRYVGPTGAGVDGLTAGRVMTDMFTPDERVLIAMLEVLHYPDNTLVELYSGFSHFNVMGIDELVSSLNTERMALHDLAVDTFGHEARFPISYIYRDHYSLGLVDSRFKELEIQQAADRNNPDPTLQYLATQVRMDKRLDALRIGIEDIERRSNRNRYASTRNWLITLAGFAGDPRYIADAALIEAAFRPVRYYDNRSNGWRTLDLGLSDDKTIALEGPIVWAGALGVIDQDMARRMRGEAFYTAAARCYVIDYSRGSSHIQRKCGARLSTASGLLPGDPRVSQLASMIDSMAAADAAALQARLDEAERIRTARREADRNRPPVFRASPPQSFISTQEWQTPSAATASSADIYRTYRERGVRICQNTGGSNCSR